MVRRFFLALLALAAPACFAADAPRPSIVLVPMFGDGVSLTIPAGWIRAHQQRTDRLAILEFVPAGQSAREWNEMITVQAFAGIPAEATPLRVLESVAARIRDVCPGKSVAIALGERKVGERAAHAAIIGCGTLRAGESGAKAGQGEVAFYLAIRGTSDMVVVQRAVRGRAFDPADPPISTPVAAAMHSALEPLSVCGLSEPPSRCGPGARR